MGPITPDLDKDIPSGKKKKEWFSSVVKIETDVRVSKEIEETLVAQDFSVLIFI